MASDKKKTDIIDSKQDIKTLEIDNTSVNTKISMTPTDFSDEENSEEFIINKVPSDSNKETKGIASSYRDDTNISYTTKSIEVRKDKFAGLKKFGKTLLPIAIVGGSLAVSLFGGGIPIIAAAVVAGSFLAGKGIVSFFRKRKEKKLRKQMANMGPVVSGQKKSEPPSKSHSQQRSKSKDNSTEEEQDTKWYQSLHTNVNKVLYSNLMSVAIIGVSIGLAVATGGIAGIAIAAVGLGIRIVANIVALRKHRREKKLLQQQKALVDYAKHKASQMVLLEMGPKKLKQVKEECDRETTPQQVPAVVTKLAHGNYKAEKFIMSLINAYSVYSGLAGNSNPVEIGKQFADISSSSAEMMNSFQFIKDSKELSELPETLISIPEALKKEPELEKELVDFINHERELMHKDGKGSYHNVMDLKNETYELKVTNAAIKDVIKVRNKRFYKDGPVTEDDKNAWHANIYAARNHLASERPDLNEEKTSIKQDILYILNPFSKPLKLEEHAGITSAVRNQVHNESISHTKPLPNRYAKDDTYVQNRTNVHEHHIDVKKNTDFKLVIEAEHVVEDALVREKQRIKNEKSDPAHHVIKNSKKNEMVH